MSSESCDVISLLPLTATRTHVSTSSFIAARHPVQEFVWSLHAVCDWFPTSQTLSNKLTAILSSTFRLQIEMYKYIYANDAVTLVVLLIWITGDMFSCTSLFGCYYHVVQSGSARVPCLSGPIATSPFLCLSYLVNILKIHADNPIVPSIRISCLSNMPLFQSRQRV